MNMVVEAKLRMADPVIYNKSMIKEDYKQHTKKFLELQKYRLNRIKADACKVLAKEDERGLKDLYEAFLIDDQSIEKYSGQVVFGAGEKITYGRILVDKRIKPFTINVSKSRNMQKKYVTLTISTDQKFKNPQCMKTYVLENSQTHKAYWQKLPVFLEPGSTKYIYFRFEIEEEDDDHIVLEDIYN